MRTNVVLDDVLMNQALRIPGIETKKQAIEEGLRLLVQVNRQADIRHFRGKLRCMRDLDHMGSDR